MAGIRSTITQILEYQERMLYPDTITSASKECLLKLDEYLELRNIDYTPSIGENWVNEYNKNAEFTEMIANKCTIFRLNFAYSPSWSPFVSSNGLRVYRYTLCEGLAAPFDSYLAYKDFKGRCESYSHPRRFLFFVQQVGVTQINQLNLNLLLLYAESFRNNTQTNIRGINEFLLFLHNNYNIPICLSFFYHYYNMYGKIQWNNIDNDTKTKIIESSNIDQSYKFDVLENFRKDSISFYYEKGYSKTSRTLMTRLTDLLMLFIFTNNYNYTFDVANIWINNVRGLFDNIPQSTRTRSILLLEEYGQNNRFTRIKSVMPSSDFYSIPEWCKEAAFDYEARKIKEGWSNSTLDMIRSSITRFCNIVHSFGVRSYKDITADIIKRFNIKDEHKTPEGKNAYNTRIRKFLIYLGEHGYLSNQMLFIALSTSGAHKEKIVVILSEEEMDQMKESLSDDSGLSLRKKAMLLLGLKMGLRSIDVVNLQYNNINWFTETIHFIQKKTDVEVELPMPPEVGNALYEYINKERPKVKNQSIFLSEYAPFEQVNRTSCQVALKDALPDREVPGSGFHVTRKTYASELLRNGVPADKVAEALGQIGTTSVHRYLSLDEERMAMCSLDFDDCFIGGW